MWDLIKTERGDETLMMTDNLKKVKCRKLELETSQRRKKVVYSVRETESREKLNKKPHTS